MMMEEDVDDDLMPLMLAQAGMNAALIIAMEEGGSLQERLFNVDLRGRMGGARRQRLQFGHGQALACIQRDYLGPYPLFPDKQFVTMFRLSKTRFQRLMEDIGNANIHFYQATEDGCGRPVASFEARLMLPLKTLAYGVACHAFRDYFSMSSALARQCCYEFDKAVKSVYEKEYLRLPTKEDVKAIIKLHKTIHKVDGMFGSLDCSHTFWHKCPKGWQGSYQGAKGSPSIVMEAICDYHLWFWHVAYGYAGTLNDKNILNLSPYLASLLDGTFLERESEVVPFTIAGEEFHKTFVLCDGIYPPYSRFVKGFKHPVDDVESKYTEWQESARKDIERAFGVLQSKFQWICRPIHLFHTNDIANRVATCMILHNMCVSDRVMDGDVHATYDPMNHQLDEEEVIEFPSDLVEEQDKGLSARQLAKKKAKEAKEAKDAEDKAKNIGLDQFAIDVKNAWVRKREWKQLTDILEHARLHTALMNLKGS